MARYVSAAERVFQQKLAVRLIEREERRKARARERETRIRLGAPTAVDVAELQGSPRIGRVD